ncbi:hypothetical protein BEK98_19815 [Streptomyces diastatochromogenes]|uniref:DUF2568 domain-containing protein n=1 Tax=Streptomyces diastatochromogenes TaxID=42236 RepID=A0A233SEP1_STRDA|nr:hypothetical protein BEK98_19815 [Streptomyces diastatochromogenes]
MILPRVKAAKAVNLGVIFLLELGVVLSPWYWAYESGSDSGPLLALFGATALGWVWGLFGSPRARFKLHGVPRVAFEALWFGAGAAMLYAAGAHAWAVAFALVCLAAKSLAYAWNQ